jgi:hypothetical protein
MRLKREVQQQSSYQVEENFMQCTIKHYFFISEKSIFFFEMLKIVLVGVCDILDRKIQWSRKVIFFLEEKNEISIWCLVAYRKRERPFEFPHFTSRKRVEEKKKFKSNKSTNKGFTLFLFYFIILLFARFSFTNSSIGFNLFLKFNIIMFVGNGVWCVDTRMRFKHWNVIEVKKKPPTFRNISIVDDDSHFKISSNTHKTHRARLISTLKSTRKLVKLERRDEFDGLILTLSFSLNYHHHAQTIPRKWG